MDYHQPGPDAQGARAFATTHWSVVLTAGQDTSPQAKDALETLCRAYWYPIYGYVRRKGYGPEEAQDLTQEFFGQMISKGHLRLADQNKGKFRTFLLATLDYFLVNEWRRAHRQKRGGGLSFVSLDQQNAEERYNLEPAVHDTPEKELVREWALTVLKRTMDALGAECEASGKGPLFQEVRTMLSGERDSGAYPGISQRLEMKEGALRTAVHRLRQRYGELLRNEVAQTVERPQEVEE